MFYAYRVGQIGKWIAPCWQVYGEQAFHVLPVAVETGVLSSRGYLAISIKS